MLTSPAFFGYGEVGSESGAPLAAILPAAAAAPAASNGQVVGGFFARDFWRSADFGLLLFGIALVYFDYRILNR